MSLFKKMFHPLYIAGSQNLPKNSFQKKICLSVNALSICIALIGCAVSVFIYFMTHNPGLVALMVTAVLLTPLPIYLNYRGRYNEAALDLYLILPATAFFFSCLIGNMAALDLMIVVLVGSARIMFVHRRLQILGYVIAVLILVVVQMSPSVQLISPIPAGGRGQALVFWSMYLAVILLVIAIFDWYGYINDNIRESAEQESKDKDRFVAKATHEIKVSFRSVFTIIEVLYKTERKQDFGGFKDAVDDLRTACKNTSSIIDNIFEYERYKAGGKPKLRNQLVNIRETLQSIADIYSHSAHEKNVTVELDVSDLIPYHIVCDEVKLRQIVVNLVHNAVKFTNNSSVVSIHATMFQRRLSIRVTDRGEGIDEHIKERIFEPFVTQNPNGLGLGLYIVREIVTALNGSIEVLNNLGGGATIIVSWQLPGREAYHLAAMAVQ